ncbi:MAG: ATP-grasp domain-containing protein [Promethearchaeota archaeon]|nr:MAG: ATP-grasp domain-containing protein [Candidatus Lokiarchaeota archaeon]
MIILEEPYVSTFLQETLDRLRIPVLRNVAIDILHVSPQLNYLSSEDFIRQYKQFPEVPPLYSSSENALEWIAQHIPDNGLQEKIHLFKDKFQFRQLMHPLYPKFNFTKVPLVDLDGFDTTTFQFPIIVKPNIGFFSVGVYKVNTAADWKPIVSKIHQEMANMQDIFPKSVVNSAEFIIEDCIEGDEYAVDVYFDKDCQPVILNVMKHIFAHPEDTSYRLYITSKEIIESTHDLFHAILQEIGKTSGIQKFPMHIEFRMTSSQHDSGQQIGIIEANPMRFAGLCVTDLAYFAYGTNNYELFFNQEKPDWSTILQGKEGKIYAMIVGTIPRELKLEDIESVDYQAFCDKLSHVMECR